MNVAHHASYTPWLEMGRTELLREGGVSYAELERAGVFLVVTKLELRYRRPILYDDVIEVRTRAHASGRIKIRHSYELVLVERMGREPDAASDPRVPMDGVCAVATSGLACVGPDGRPKPLPMKRVCPPGCACLRSDTLWSCGRGEGQQGWKGNTFLRRIPRPPLRPSKSCT